jgi:GTP cyclohydrolase II
MIKDVNSTSAMTNITKHAEADFPTQWGHFRIHGFTSANGEECVAVVMGELKKMANGSPLVRVHSQCLTGDVFHSLRCDCRQQLELALKLIAAEGEGVLVYEMQEGRGIGLMAKLKAYSLQDQGMDTVEANVELGFKADEREYELPAQVLKALGVLRLRLLSNNPKKVAAMEAAGITVMERVTAEVEPSEHAEKYMQTKKEKMGHLIG